MSQRFVVITGCSGAGKSSLSAELRRRGHHVIDEPGRRVVQKEVESGGQALPWIDMAAFAARVIDLAIADCAEADRNIGEWTFFDRSLVDAACALEHETGEPALTSAGLVHRYHSTVFFAEPWPEIYVTDSERRHSFASAKAEAERLGTAYADLGYNLVPLPKFGVGERADFVLSRLTPPNI